MSWTAVVLAGFVLAQVPTVPEGLQNAPLAPQVGGIGSASGEPSQGIGALDGVYGNQRGSSLAPLSDAESAEPWRPSLPAVPTVPKTAQPAAPTPATNDSMLGTGGENERPALNSNIWERLNFLEQSRTAKSAAPKTDSQAVDPRAVQGLQQDLAPASNYNVDPLAAQRSAIQFAAVQHLTPEEMLKQAMTLPPNSVVAGRRVTLLDVLGQVSDRAKRLEITHAYWQLVRQLGEYHFCWEESRQLESIGLGTIDANLLSSAQQAADRELTAAELSLIQAQYRLAEVAELDSSGQLPLPADLPHINTYTTHFEKIFEDRTPPGKTRLIHRTMPLQHQLIGVRTEAVHASQDALKEVVRSYSAGQVDAADALTALHDVTGQRRAWINAVANYNHSIADYALAIAGPETKGRDLVSILIKLSKAEPQRAPDSRAQIPSRSPTLARKAGGETFQAPAEEDTTSTRPGVPTLAPPRKTVASEDASQGIPPVPVDSVPQNDLSATPASAESSPVQQTDRTVDPAVKPAVAEAPATNQPTPAVPESREPEQPEAVAEKVGEPTRAPTTQTQESEGATSVAGVDSNSEIAQPDSEAAETASPAPKAPERSVASETADRAGASPATGDMAVQTRPMVPIEDPAVEPRSHTVNRQLTPSVPGQTASLHASLVGLTPGVQAKRLTALLHGGVRTIVPDAEAVDLEACLDGVSGGNRRSVIEAYWEASLRVAEYQVYRTRVAFLAELGKAVTLGAVGTPDAVARLKRAQLDAKANLLEAEARLLDARYELTKRCGRSLDGPWLVPATLPHAGDYRLHLESMPRQLAESWTLKELAAIIPALNSSLKARAAAVIEADSRRMQAMNAYGAGQARFSHVLSAVDQQAEECLEFLNVLATYNQSIAEYVTVVVPETLPKEQLVATLVVRRQ